ncbi:MAG: membrane protein insertion efficiency factor YidD [Parcubacteria group bacterium]|nr:membrane protein insertion efficiency factor YidD [Parcubacteria group bacterium]
MQKLIKYTQFIFKLPFLAIIRLYQKTISPDHGLFRFFFPHGYCRFYPSCSEYSRQSIKKKGLILGIFKSIWRVLRCNPWNKGGVDLP